MTPALSTITTELLRHADGRPVAYVDGTAIVVFAYQQPDGTYVIDICTRDDIPRGQLLLLLDGEPLSTASGAPAVRRAAA
jgi:hypothetical protein